MKLYHGTTERVAKLALTEGLKPRALTGVEGHWKHTVDSNPAHVYLTSVYAPYFACTAAKDGERWAVIEVDTDLLDEERMRPDEDFLEQATRGAKGALGPKSRDMKVRTRWFRKRLEAFAHHWRDSVKGLGTCSYAGELPPEAITRVAVFAPTGYIHMMAADPAICIMNYKVCGGKYAALTRWIIGEEVTPDDILGWSAPLTPVEEKQKLARLLEDRSTFFHLK